jgi:hypothetical protein
MSFSSDFASCMSPLPTPGDIFDSFDDVTDFMHQLHQAWENAGGEAETTLGAIAALGAVTGLDEVVLAAFATAGSVTVLGYLAACAGCLVVATGSSIWDLISSAEDSVIGSMLASAANEKGIPQPSGEGTTATA